MMTWPDADHDALVMWTLHRVAALLFFGNIVSFARDADQPAEQTTEPPAAEVVETVPKNAKK